MNNEIETGLPRRGAIFDLDGTLVNSGRLNKASFVAVTQQFGLSTQGLGYDVLCAGPIEAAYRFMTKKEDVERYCEAHRAFQGANLHLIEGYEDTFMVVHILHCFCGFKIGIVSNRSSWIPKICRLIGIREYVECIIGIQKVEKAKPHPEGIRRAMKSLNCKPSGTFFAGDMPSDVFAGNIAGVTAIAVDRGECSFDLKTAGPNYMAKNLRDILPWVVPNYEHVKHQWEDVDWKAELARATSRFRIT